MGGLKTIEVHDYILVQVSESVSRTLCKVWFLPWTSTSWALALPVCLTYVTQVEKYQKQKQISKNNHGIYFYSFLFQLVIWNIM